MGFHVENDEWQKKIACSLYENIAPFSKAEAQEQVKPRC